MVSHLSRLVNREISREERKKKEKKPVGAHILTHLRFNSVCCSIITGKKGANKRPQSSTGLKFTVKQTVMLCSAAYSKKTNKQKSVTPNCKMIYFHCNCTTISGTTK